MFTSIQLVTALFAFGMLIIALINLIIVIIKVMTQKRE